MRKLKVYFFTFKDLGKAMHNISQEVLRYCPEWVEPVATFDECDFVVEHIIGDHFASPFIQDKNLSHRIKSKPFVLFLYCVGCPMEQVKTNGFFQWAFDNATMIQTYLPVELYGLQLGDNIHRSPLGYDHNVYKYEPVFKTFRSIMTTGYVAAYEALEEVYHAAKIAGGTMHHVGHNFRWDIETYKHYEKIPNNKMRDLYLYSKFVSGLRRGEGFELPVLEGAACGARPIVFNNPHYHWFKKFACYIEETNFVDVRQQIYNLLIEDKDVTVDKETLEYIRNTFAWDVVAPAFWNALESRI